MKLITAIVRPNKLDDLKQVLSELGIHGLTIAEVRGHGRQKGHKEVFRGKEYVVDVVPKVRIDVALADEEAEAVVTAIENAARTGDVGDGKIFITNLEDCVRIRTGERGEEAL